MTKQIPLYNGKIVLVDDDDYERLSQYKWIYVGGYAARNSGGYPWRYKREAMHTAIMHPPAGMTVDHKNGNKLDNRKENLRICTRAQNRCNSTSPRNTSGFRGVQRVRHYNSWKASIGVGYKVIYLGSFHSPEEAARAYDEAAKKYHGEFATLNFPRKEDK